MRIQQQDDYPLGHLILEYLRVFIWPLVILLVVVVYQEDVRKILSEREVDIFGLRIGKVVDIEQRARAEIADIRQLLESQRARGGVRSDGISQDIETKLNSLEQNLSREIEQIRRSPAPAARVKPERASSSGGTRAVRAAAAEQRGFEALLERDLTTAIQAFEEAKAVWPDYHNVAELLALLEERRTNLASGGDKGWRKLYRIILTRYSWGLPEDLRPRLRAEVTAAY